MTETPWLTKPKSSQSLNTQTVVRKDVRAPTGHIIVSEKWQRSQLADELKSKVNLKFENNLGVVDFHVHGNVVVIYISEADLVSGNSYRQKLAKFKTGKMGQSVVFVEVTPLSEQYFQDVQKFIVMSLRLNLVTVSSQKDAAQALAHLVMLHSQHKTNPFLLKRRLPPVEVTMAKVLQTIPGLGPVKVQALLMNFPDLPSISNASIEDLAGVLSVTDAENVFSFFNQDRSQKHSIS